MIVGPNVIREKSELKTLVIGPKGDMGIKGEIGVEETVPYGIKGDLG